MGFAHPNATLRNRGFTLIELMIAVAILGILAAVAVTAYQDDLRVSRMAKVSAHYRVAADYVRWHFANSHIRVAQGLQPEPAVPTDAAGWVTLIDDQGVAAPGGGPAFVAGAGDATTGAIGIAAQGSWNNMDAAVTVTRPAYAELTAQSIVLHALGY